MKRLNIFLFSIFILGSLFFTSCTPDKDAVLVITERRFEIENTGKGVFYFTVTNKGEQPAYNVIVMAEAFREEKSVGYEEKGVGNLFANEEESDTLHFHNFGYLQPDTVKVMMTYTPYNAMR